MAAGTNSEDRVEYASQPLGTSQGFKVAFMNLGGAAPKFRQSKLELPRYKVQLLVELGALMAVSHVVVVTEIIPFWYEWVKEEISWEIRHDEDDVAMLWDPRVCNMVEMKMEKIYPDESDLKLCWRRALHGLFTVGEGHPYHWVIGSHTKHGSANNKLRCTQIPGDTPEKKMPTRWGS